jgi:hypothetical protein
MTQVLFQPIEGRVVLTANGIYKEAALVVLDGKVFAQHSSGYIRLKEHGRTSHSKVFWAEIQTDDVLSYDMGNLSIPKQKSSQSLKAV